jgi:hypothetical protein
VHHIPVVVVLAPDGHELKREVGFQSPDEMLAFLASAAPAPAAR